MQKNCTISVATCSCRLPTFGFRAIIFLLISAYSVIKWLFTFYGHRPVKWTAFDALLYGTDITKSDVLVQALITFCNIATHSISQMDGRKIANLLQQGYRMPRPQHIDALLYGTDITKSDVLVQALITFCNIATHSISQMDGRKIANLLQQGYRMPRPQHIDDKL